MVFLILESLGSTELVFILVMALVFLGPRRLPQLSRTLGKHLASFRKASEDFKRTWEKEVSLEELNLSRIEMETNITQEENSLLDHTEDGEPLQPSLPTIEAVEADRVFPRESPAADKVVSSKDAGPVVAAEPLSKRDWL